VTEPGLDRTANLLGALSLVISDRATDAISDAAVGSESAAAALSSLLQFLDRPSVDLLRQVLGLTSSGTVRLLDRLESAGYVKRGPGRDGRSTAVSLTPAGRTAAKRVAAGRAGVLERSLQALSPEERRAFDQLLSKVLVAQIRGPGAVRWMCRLCDPGACGRDEGSCPVANAARERYGDPDRGGRTVGAVGLPAGDAGAAARTSG
jgi:DNA-binding MarR family transcriptional regulator